MSPVSTYSFRAAFSLGGWDSMKLQSASLLLISLASSSNLLHFSSFSSQLTEHHLQIPPGEPVAGLPLVLLENLPGVPG